MELFGRNYETVGTSDSDYCIQTKGQLKVKWGNKFIDVIKNGKLNVETPFYEQSTVGNKDGIYVLGSDNVVLVVNQQQYQLLPHPSSAKEHNFEVSSEETSSAKNTSLDNTSTSEEVSDSKTTTLNNDLFSEDLDVQVYTENESNWVKATYPIKVLINNKNKLQLYYNNLICSIPLSSSKDISNGGYKLYVDDDNQGTLEIDNIIVKKSLSYLKDGYYTGKELNVEGVPDNLKSLENYKDFDYSTYLWYYNGTWQLLWKPYSSGIYLASTQEGPSGHITYYNGTYTTVTDISNVTDAIEGPVISDLFYRYIYYSEDGTTWTLIQEYPYIPLSEKQVIGNWDNYCGEWYSNNELIQENLEGTVEQWQNEVWRTYFLERSIGVWLNANKDKYSSLGFLFNNDGAISCIGNAGQWNAFLKSENQLSNFSGYIIQGNYKIEFSYTNLDIGLKLEGITQSDYQDCYEITCNSNYIIRVLDLQTNEITTINGNRN